MPNWAMPACPADRRSGPAHRPARSPASHRAQAHRRHEHPALDANAFARCIGDDEIAGEGVVPVVFAVGGQPILEKRTDGLRWRDSLYSLLHYLVSIGVEPRPRNTMLKR